MEICMASQSKIKPLKASFWIRIPREKGRVYTDNIIKKVVGDDVTYWKITAFEVINDRYVDCEVERIHPMESGKDADFAAKGD